MGQQLGLLHKRPISEALGKNGPSHTLPVILGAGKPPLDCSGSPRSKLSRGLGLYSRLGREVASRILQVKGEA